LDEANADSITDELSRLVEEEGRKELVVDFGRVAFLSSSTLSVFLHLHRKLHSSGGRLTLYNLRPEIQEVFAVTNLDRLLDIRSAGAPV
jgi:anti-sigma B factor antagonist